MEYVEFSGKSVDEALTNALVALGTTSDQIEYEVIEEGSNGIFGIGSKDAVIKVAKKSSPEDIVKNFLSEVFEKMNLEVEIITKVDDIEGYIEVELKGPEMGVLIGKRGQTLDSLQYLTNLALNRKNDNYMRVKIDTEDYRRRRKETLENLAKNVSYKVKKTRKNVSLEAMNPYERRIIHSALQNDKYVETHSEGEEPYRHVVVTLKK
ncbi:MAG: protein jag [Lachnospiraceae bacterium]|jgi:spoIIIJ-associated protein|nr:protein jag [Lachnospiraceae bacterium]